jgi:hypothetical protein
MFKVVFFLWRRADFSRARFIDYYENSHAGLTKQDGTDELLVPEAVDYRRNFPIWRTEHHPVFPGPHFDVMTEMWFNGQSEFEDQLKVVTTSPGRERISADEAKFLDRTRQALFIVTECATETSHADGPLTKLVHFGRRQPQVSRQQFRERYERVAGDFGQQISGLVEHRRNYPLFEHPLSFQGGHHNQSAPDDTAFPLDLVEEFWLRDGADVAGLGATVRTASEGLIDQLRTPIVPVEEFRSPWGRPAAPGAGPATGVGRG